MKLTKEQKKWQKFSEEPGWVKSDDLELRAKVLARNTKLRSEKEAKSASINTRIAPSDLEGIKRIANEKAIPYQTLLGHILHEYVAGNLVDVKEVRKAFKIKAG
jgi:predicted DNA binding CopG/RHH family protein